MVNGNPRVFADANVLIRGVTFPRFPYEILRLAAQHSILLVVSPSVLDDARHYLGELFPEHLPKLGASNGMESRKAKRNHPASLGRASRGSMADNPVIFYDREADVLYLTIGEPQEAVSKEMGNDVLLRVDPNTEKIVGMTVLNFTSRFSDLAREQRLPVQMELHAQT